MKKCDLCEKNFELLIKGSGGHNRRYCYECYPDGLTKSERGILRASLLRKKAEKHKIEIGCKICGYNKTSIALDWHHIDDNKTDSPSNLLNKSWSKYEQEISKCVLLCSNCHREIHGGFTKL